MSVAIPAMAFAASAWAQQQPATPEASPAPAASPEAAAAPDGAADVAKQLANPISALISVPFQWNVDTGYGGDGAKYTTNIQPVIPIRLNANWNLISRTIVPVVYQEDIAPGSGSQFGLSDTLQSFFLSPARGKLIWGVGPAVLMPTATDTLLGTGKWSVGPTAVALTQSKGWTVGMLANQLWSFAGDRKRGEYNKTYFQPFLSYTTREATTYSLSAEGTYDWLGHNLSMPLIVSVGQVAKVGGQLISVTVGLKYYVATVENGPRGFGGRLALTLLFPRR